MPVYRAAAVLCLVIVSAPPTWAQEGAGARTASIGWDLGMEAGLIVVCAAFALLLSASMARQ